MTLNFETEFLLQKHPYNNTIVKVGSQSFQSISEKNIVFVVFLEKKGKKKREGKKKKKEVGLRFSPRQLSKPIKSVVKMKKKTSDTFKYVYDGKTGTSFKTRSYHVQCLLISYFRFVNIAEMGKDTP